MAPSPPRPRGRSRRLDRSTPCVLPPAGPAERRTRLLIERARHGEHEAKGLLVQQYLGLVVAVARRYRHLGLPDEDLTQEGAIGLLEAIERFDPASGASFATYAHWRVRQSICHALSSRGRLLRLPKEISERRRLIARTRSALVNRGTVPTTDEIAERTGLSTAQVIEAVEAPTLVASLDAGPVDGVSPAAGLADPARPDPALDAIGSRVSRAVEEAVRRLPARERAVIEAHYGLGRDEGTLAEIGAELGLSETRVRALERRALDDLATQLEPELAQSWPPAA